MIFTLPDPTTSWSNSLAARSKVWIKRLDGVDRNISTGYAFLGEFRKVGATEEAPVGTFYLVYYEQRRGSRKLDSRDVDLYRVTDDTEKPLVYVEGWYAGTEDGWALRVRDEIADLMEKASTDHAKLREERTRLVARIAEIDEILGKEEETGA